MNSPTYMDMVQWEKRGNCLSRYQTISRSSRSNSNVLRSLCILNSQFRPHQENTPEKLSTRTKDQWNKLILTPVGIQRRSPLLILSVTVVVCVDTSARILRRYKSENAAYMSIGVHQSSISACCRGKQATAGGFRWRFCELPETMST
jgi:hypothetical protein